MKQDLLFYAVGDVGPNRKDPYTIFDQVSPVLKKGDIAFCQLETNLSLEGSPSVQARLPMRAHPDGASALKKAGFNVVSFASNHCLDWGEKALLDTLDAVSEQNIAIIGAGRNIEQARKPAIIEKKDTRVAVLAYNSILPSGYQADENRPGCAPMRAFTIYEQIEMDQPGTPCRIHTFPHKDDLKAMVTDIRKVKEKADIVIVSLHCGIHFVPAQLADYQKQMAKTAIDSGADLVLCHHAHILKGIEVYKGCAIMYGLGNFAIENPASFMKGLLETKAHKEIEALNPNWNHDDDFPLPPETRNTFVVKCVISQKKIETVSILPAYINKQSQPEILNATDDRFESVLDYIKMITKDQKISTDFKVKDNEVVIV